MSTEIQLVETSGFKLMSPDDRKRFLDDMQKFTKSVNENPSKTTTESINGKNIKYIPISVLEKDLDKVYFGMVQYEILWSKQVLNEFEVAARIKVFHPILMQWLNYDGIGAALIQQKSNTEIIDFHVYKLQTALKLAAPNAYSEAIKNAAKKIGKRFGADLMRKIEDNYQPYNMSNNKQPKFTGDIQINSKAELLKAYAEQKISTEQYNELLTQFPDSLN
jgi:hypothetical protein